MPRPKGSKNKTSSAPFTVGLPTEGKINYLANIMIERIIEDQKNGAPLLKKIRDPKTTYMLRVFTDNDGNFGDAASVVIDEGRYIPGVDRPSIARKFETGETIFINDLTTADISIVHPQGEISFAGVGVLGAAWLITKLQSKPVETLQARGGKIAVWQEDDLTWARADISLMPDWRFEQLENPHMVEKIKLEDTKTMKHTMVWAWTDESKGLVRARTFATDWDIAEAQGNGSGSMILASRLNRELEILHGQGSVTYAKPEPDGRAAIGGRVVEDTIVNLEVA